MNLGCRMADLGMTIVTVVHQPRYGIFILFDEVLLLGKSGRTVFQGPSTVALPYFNSLGFELPPNENPADFCLDVVSGSIPCQGRPDFRPEVRCWSSVHRTSSGMSADGIYLAQYTYSRHLSRLDHQSPQKNYVTIGFRSDVLEFFCSTLL